MTAFLILSLGKFLTLWGAFFFGITWVNGFRSGNEVPAMHTAIFVGALAGFITLTFLL